MKKLKMKALVATLLLAVGLVTTGCGSTNETKDETANTSPSAVTEDSLGVDRETSMVIRATADAKVVHPLYANDRLSLTLVNNIFAPLARRDGIAIREGILAESIETSSDFLTYTVKLKKDLKWHDGKAITADDLIFTCETIADPNQGSHLVDTFKMPDGTPIKIAKVDDLTVTFTLPSPQVDYIASIADIRPFPKHVYENIDNIQKSDVAQKPVGSGPYKFESVKAGENWILAKFDDYVMGTPQINHVVYRIIPDATTAQFAFENGEIDSMYVFPENVEKLKSKGSTIMTFDEDRVGYLLINQNNEFLKNKDIRQAICYAINREELIMAKYMSMDYAKPAKSFLAEKAMYLNNEVEPYDYNPEKAKDLVKKSGLSNVKLNLVYIGKNDTQELMVKQYLEAVGIQVNLKAMEFGAFYDALFNPAENKEYDLAFNGYIYGQLPSSYANVFMTGSPENVNNYSNTKVDDLFKAAAIETDNAKREQMYKEIQKIVIDDASMYPVEYGYALVAANPRIKGLDKAVPASIYMFEDLSKAYIEK